MATAQQLKERGNAFFNRKQYEQAAEWYSKAIDAAPETHALYTNRAAALANLGRWEDSLADALQATTLKDDWTKGYYRQGVALMQLDRVRDACAALEKGAKLEPGNAQMKELLEQAKERAAQQPLDHTEAKAKGNACYKEGQYEGAIRWYTTALEMCPAEEVDARAVLHTNRAECHRQLTHIKDVVADCSKALELKPDSVKALIRRALAYEYLEKYQLGLNDFSRALEIDPSAAMASDGKRRMAKAVQMEKNFS